MALDPFILPLRNPSPDGCVAISIHHLTLPTTPDQLFAFLHRQFSEEVERGDTYPQESPVTVHAFRSYFFPADVFVAIGLTHVPQSIDLETARAGREWPDCVLGFYYIKPNYVGRSSHICNAGFVVPKSARGCGIGLRLGESYLHFAPLLGYKASVFNLVFESNTASLAIWDRLGFERVGRVPDAGRLKQPDGSEKLVAAHIIWKRFD
ncbi:hypothetical protein FRB99_004963 [Tulasnella sp. 403]|nr:hypothetical protein FRB99_004963 [Tulasnella sp. 403]